MVCATSKASGQPAHLRSACAYAQSGQSLCLSLEYSISVKPLTEHHLEFLRLKGGCTGSPESTLVKLPHCWKSHVAAQSKLKRLHKSTHEPVPIKSYKLLYVPIEDSGLPARTRSLIRVFNGKASNISSGRKLRL